MMSGLDIVGFDPSDEFDAGLDLAQQFWADKGVSVEGLLDAGMTLEQVVTAAEEELLFEADFLASGDNVPEGFRPVVRADVYGVFEDLHAQLEDDAQLAELMGMEGMSTRVAAPTTGAILRGEDMYSPLNSGSVGKKGWSKLKRRAEADFKRLRAKDKRVHDEPGAVRDAVTEWTRVIVDSDFAVESDARMDGEFTHPDDL